MAKKRAKSPSRERYEQRRPVLSFRVSRNIYDQLRVINESTGDSRTKVLMTGLGLCEAKARTEKEIWQEGYDKGYDDAATEACDYFQVTYPCHRCGKEMVVNTDMEKKAIRQYLMAHGWGHTECHKKVNSEG